MDRLIKFTLAFAIALSATVLVFKDSVRELSRAERFPVLHQYLKRRRTTVTVMVGSVLDILVTLTSVGAGALGTAALIALYPGLTMPTL